MTWRNNRWGWLAIIVLSAGLLGCDKVQSWSGTAEAETASTPPASAAPAPQPTAPPAPNAPTGPVDVGPVIRAPQAQTVQIPNAPAVRNVAIFIKNTAPAVMDEKVRALEELVSARITDKGFSVISREDAANAVAGLAGAGANAGDARLAGAQMDKLLSNNTSALRLAQNLGADYVFTVSITTFDQQKRTVKAYGVERLTTTAKLRLSYKILDKFIGGTLGGDVVEASKVITEDKNASETLSIDDLLDEAAQKLAAGLEEKVARGKIREVAGDTRLVPVGFVCGSADMEVPDIVRNDKGEYIVTANKYRVEAMNVTVQVDGVAVGTAPNTFQLAKGLHKLRLSRDGYKDHESTITVQSPQTFRIDMQMDAAGYARWQQTSVFLQGLKNGQKLTDAEVKVMEGAAQMLRQSGMKVDVKIEGDGKGLVQNTIWPFK